MTELPIAPLPDPVAPPLFLLSFRHRDELAATVSRAGWRVIAARRVDGLEQRFVTSGARVAVIDARGALEAGLGAARSLADAAQANASALLVLISHGDISALDGFHEAGATHYLASPFGEGEFGQALRFAERHADRLAAGWRSIGAVSGETQPPLTWAYATAERRFTPSEGLVAQVSAVGSPRDFYRQLDARGRAAAREALRRLRKADATAFTHVLPGTQDLVVHHLVKAPDGLSGTIEMAVGDTVAQRRYRDMLTGLADGGEARRWIAQAMKRGPGTQLLLISVNRFEMVNTAYGRPTGDALLKAAARRIEKIASDIGGRRTLIARMAGAEFLVGVAPGMTIERVQFMAGQIVASVARPFLSGTDTITLGCRIGIVAAEGAADGEVTELLRRASAALADAKAQDSGPIRLLRGEDAIEGGWQTELAVDLRLALAQDEIEILFQPQIAITTGEVVGVEALARWQHPTYGELGATTLFATADRSDYLPELSDHIQRRAIAAAASWPAALSGLRLSVNVTAGDLGRPGFAAHFMSIADDAGFDRRRLTVEVTESGLIDDLGAAASLLAALRAGGCRVAIDDFGTGYSSLAYLKALPLDYLKIDKKLSEDIVGSKRDRVVVRGVIEMARSLGLGVIAEGVETDIQLALLAEEGCTYYQGFLCSEPVATDDLVGIVATRCLGSRRLA